MGILIYLPVEVRSSTHSDTEWTISSHDMEWTVWTVRNAFPTYLVTVVDVDTWNEHGYTDIDLLLNTATDGDLVILLRQELEYKYINPNAVPVPDGEGLFTSDFALSHRNTDGTYTVCGYPFRENNAEYDNYWVPTHLHSRPAASYPTFLFGDSQWGN